jgi:predicted Rdx family selenoprotein
VAEKVYLLVYYPNGGGSNDIEVDYWYFLRRGGVGGVPRTDFVDRVLSPVAAYSAPFAWTKQVRTLTTTSDATVTCGAATVLAPPVGFYTITSGDTVALKARMDAAFADIKDLRDDVRAVVTRLVQEIANLYDINTLVQRQVIAQGKAVNSLQVNLRALRETVRDVIEVQNALIAARSADNSLFGLGDLGNMELPLRILTGAGAIMVGFLSFGSTDLTQVPIDEVLGSTIKITRTMYDAYNTLLESTINAAVNAPNGDYSNLFDIVDAVTTISGIYSKLYGNLEGTDYRTNSTLEIDDFEIIEKKPDSARVLGPTNLSPQVNALRYIREITSEEERGAVIEGLQNIL